jgi:hypothetical protein
LTDFGQIWHSRPSFKIAFMAALALGAAALGDLVIGAVAIGRLTIGGLGVRKARFQSVEIDDLTVRRLRVLEATPSTQEIRGDE